MWHFYGNLMSDSDSPGVKNIRNPVENIIRLKPAAEKHDQHRNSPGSRRIKRPT